MKFSRLRWQAFHNVGDQHAHDLLRFSVNSLTFAQFHWSPWRTESSSDAHERCKFLHQDILELAASVSVEHGWNCSTAKDASCKHSAGFPSIAFRGFLNQDAVTDAAYVRHGVLVARLRRRIPRSFQIDHDFLPTFRINRNSCLRRLFSGDFPESNAGDACRYPFVQIFFHASPPNLPG